MDPMKKTDLLQKNAEKYKSMDPMKKRDLLKKNDEKYNKFFIHDIDYYISRFHNRINEGPYYVCSVCNRLLYRKSVVLLKKKIIHQC